MVEISSMMLGMGEDARIASRKIATLTTDKKNAALLLIADELEANADKVLAANAQDIEQAREKGLSEALIDRLLLTEERVANLAADVRKVAALPDPVGQEYGSSVLPNGIRLSRRRVPIGVLGVIYEARPNVTIDIATLSLKTGNAVILRGGSETLKSNLALVQVIQKALVKTGLPSDAVQYIRNPDRAFIGELLHMDKYVDMIIPRGGAGLHRFCIENSTIPVITGGLGICHLYVEPSADFDKAVEVIINAKVQRPSVCNALDTLLVHRDIAAAFLPKIAKAMSAYDVTLHADTESYAVMKRFECVQCVPAGPEDFDQEWLSLDLGVRVVSGLDQAIAHIQAHSTEHSDGILTNDWGNAMRFVNEINSAAVFVNASTRFNDGGQFGLGAEVAVSTQKLHARGPMGLEELTTYKWVVLGNYHSRP